MFFSHLSSIAPMTFFDDGICKEIEEHCSRIRVKFQREIERHDAVVLSALCILEPPLVLDLVAKGSIFCAAN